MLAPIAARDGIGGISATDVLYVLVAVSFTASGAIAWTRRPDSQVGALMTCVAILWAGDFLLLQASSPLVFTLGGLGWNLVYVIIAVILLAFPSGRLASSAPERLVVGSVLFAALPMELVRLLFFEPGSGPRNVLQISPRPGIADAISTAQRVVLIAAIAALLAILLKRWLDATGPRRRALAPALAGIPLFVLAGVIAVNGTVPQALWPPLLVALLAALVTLLAFLLQARLARSAVADLLVELRGPGAGGRARRILARAAGSVAEGRVLAPGVRGLCGHRRHPGGRVPRDRPGDDADRSQRPARGGAAHDPYLREEPELLDAVGPQPGWRSRTRGFTLSCWRASTTCRSPAYGSWRPPRTSAAGSSATSTTAPSGAWSRSRWSCGRSNAGSSTIRRRSGVSTRRAAS